VVVAECKPLVSGVFRILAGVLAVLCFLLAAVFIFIPNAGGEGLFAAFFVLSGIVMRELATTGRISWSESARQQGDPVAGRQS
jgi:hypothetical protein